MRDRPSTQRVPGGWLGRVEMAPDFDELAAAFHGEVAGNDPASTRAVPAIPVQVPPAKPVSPRRGSG